MVQPVVVQEQTIKRYILAYFDFLVHMRLKHFLNWHPYLTPFHIKKKFFFYQSIQLSWL